MEAEIKFNAAGLTAGVKRAAHAPSPELSAKAGVLGNYLESNSDWVGTVTNPGRYVSGVASLQYGVMADYVASLAVFGGVVDGVKLALIGSPASLVGAAADTTANHSLDYYVLRFLGEDAENGQASSSAETYEAAVEETLNPGVLPSTAFCLKFLAKPLFYNERVLVATPIYVALAD
ncbi:hypothetical protein G3I70_01700 [Actinomadura bangladeshensis]|uniref:Uncharacterized protein n=1 Tax=Actinomadura bangladeshensis TaxID=453573 RepID=A0A6L9Q704_9ACTN|nr:hypothetical protein [Actinomadura bangladeshensis]